MGRGSRGGAWDSLILLQDKLGLLDASGCDEEQAGYPGDEEDEVAEVPCGGAAGVHCPFISADPHCPRAHSS